MGRDSHGDFSSPIAAGGTEPLMSRNLGGTSGRPRRMRGHILSDNKTGGNAIEQEFLCNERRDTANLHCKFAWITDFVSWSVRRFPDKASLEISVAAVAE